MERWWQYVPKAGVIFEFTGIWIFWKVLEKIPGNISKKPDFIYMGEQCLPCCKQSTGIHSHGRGLDYLSHQIKGEGDLDSLGRGMIVEENKRAMDSMLKQNLQEVTQQMQTLQEAFQSMQDSTRCDLEHLKTHLHNEQGRTVKAIITEAMDSMRQKDLQQLSQQTQTRQTASQTTLGYRQSNLQNLREDHENELDLSELLSYKGDVTLDADTAHPRLEISADGQKVKDTGVIRHVPSNEKRFDSHLFVLAKEGYTSGKHYWEVYVGRRRSWALGIAQESVTRKGPVTLSPQNGFWAIGLADGRDYWAYTDRWTRLSASGKLKFFGIFLDVPAKEVTFYDSCKEAALYTFSIADGSIQEGKFIPFFSTGPATAEPDTEPLVIV